MTERIYDGPRNLGFTVYSFWTFRGNLSFHFSFSRSRSRNSARSKMELFTIIVNGFRLDSPLVYLLSVTSHVTQFDLGKRYHLDTIYNGVYTTLYEFQFLLDIS